MNTGVICHANDRAEGAGEEGFFGFLGWLHDPWSGGVPGRAF